MASLNGVLLIGSLFAIVIVLMWADTAVHCTPTIAIPAQNLKPVGEVIFDEPVNNDAGSLFSMLTSITVYMV